MRRRQGQGEGEQEGFPPPPSKPKLRKGLWSPEEDEKLIAYIFNNGMLGSSWAYVAKQAGLQRCGKSCRLRWINYLRPGLKRGAFSRQEERLIINLQSMIGNRWSQIAAQLPGRTDNEIKNYWNSAIKKKFKLKNHVPSPTTDCNTNAKSTAPYRSRRICNTDSVFSHASDALTSFHSAQPYLDAMPEGYQRPSNSTSFNVETTGENQFCVPGVLELKPDELVQDQDDDINKLISYFEARSHAAFLSPSQQAQDLNAYNTAKSSTCGELITESCSTTVPALEAPGSANYSLGSTGITIPAVVEHEFLNEKLENDRWSTGHSSSDVDDGCHVTDPGAYTVHEAGISTVETYKSLYEKTADQSYPPLSFRSQYGKPAIKWPAGQSNEFQAEDNCTDGFDLRYDVNLGIAKYIDNCYRQKSYQLPHIDAGVGHERGFSITPHEQTVAISIPTTSAVEGNGPFHIESKGRDSEDTGWPQDDIYNLNAAAASDFNEIYFS